jgi:hypothetical protein
MSDHILAAKTKQNKTTTTTTTTTTTNKQTNKNLMKALTKVRPR